MEDFGKDLRRLLDGVNQPSILYGNVDSVDEETKTINVRIGDAGLVIPDISLSNVIGGDASVIFYPAVNSAVILGVPYQQPENAFVVSFTRVDKIEASVGGYFANRQRIHIFVERRGRLPHHFRRYGHHERWRNRRHGDPGRHNQCHEHLRVGVQQPYTRLYMV